MVDAPGYAGKLGAEVPAPITDREIAGSAHLWVRLPVAAAAIGLIIAEPTRPPRLAAGRVAICGVLGIAVAFAIDVPRDSTQAVQAWPSTALRPSCCRDSGRRWPARRF